MSHLWNLYMFAEICILTIQRGKICVCVFATWGHIDAAFRLLAFEYVSVGIEGRTAQTGSHLNKQAQQPITMSLESDFCSLALRNLFFISLYNTAPKLHVLYFERQTSNRICFMFCTCNLTGLEMLQDQWNFTQQFSHCWQVTLRFG